MNATDYPIRQVGDMPRTVELWHVQGIPGLFWPSKIVAEAVARRAFPFEGAGANYARIYYSTFVRERDL